MRALATLFPMKIAFMGTPALAVPCLDALAQEHEIAVVVTQPDKLGGRGGKQLLAPPVKTRALELGVPVLQPDKARDAAFIEELEAFGVDAMAVVAYGQILPDAILEMAPRGCVNLHFSLLPRWRGAAPVQYAIWKGDRVTGVTTQWMAQKLDAGDIIAQHEVEIEPQETSGELLQRLTVLGAPFLRETFQMLENGTAPRTPQNEELVTFCPQITRDDAKIAWTMRCDDIVNTVRAMNPWPTAWCEFRGEPLKIWTARSVVARSGAPGTLLEVSREGPVIAVGEGAVVLESVQGAGKARMTGGDWARGARLENGARFE